MKQIYIKWIIFACLMALVGSFFAQKIYFVNADIGRHIRNGEYFFKQGHPAASNYYSYTEPDFPLVNHHWGSGVIYYLTWKILGFGGITVLNAVIYLLTFFLFFKASERLSSFNFALFFSVLSLPLFTSRTEIRPEAFSFLFMGLFFYTLLLFRDGRISFGRLLILVPAQLLWANLHLFFIMGPFLIGVFWFEGVINNKYRKSLKPLMIFGILTVLACFINPYGLKGFLEPFMIMREYGYMLAENQSVIFMHKRFPGNPLYYHFEALFLLAVISYIPIFMKKGQRDVIPFLFMMVLFGGLSWGMIRNIPFFGFFFIPIVSMNFFLVFKDKRNKGTAVTLISACVLIIFYLTGLHQSPFKKVSGIGLYPSVNRSARFFKTFGLSGPIFNNYDIGGYLIYHLYPRQEVFVDNRPEAYSVGFFKDIYEPMQSDEDRWSAADKEYGFNCIYFFRHDITPHAQPFLIKRIKDPLWAPVYVDAWTIILLKRNNRNAGLIKRFELPKSIFSVS
ncbi:MAG: hypothetical protein ISS26_01095 [Candidatus Omnitrophica bacterium]|nr:hypothetical protein [Candidatus Omnitrophota bacterium]